METLMDLNENDMVHVTKVGPTGALSQVDTMISIKDLVAFVLAKLPPVAPVDPA